ncbi:MAG: hypothetical protein HYY00_07410 [Chloroflexi bacterium]|nr:hypothetical protein [Chloroflexota bacterium]
MTTRETGWRRDRLGLRVWPHRGKVAIVGWGMSPVDRRWDGVSMDKTLGAYGILAIQRCLEDAGVKAEDVDGLLVCPETGAGATGGSSADWGPTRPYFAPPYDSEWGLSRLNAKWLTQNTPGLKNVKYAPEQVPAIGEEMGMAAEAVATGRCKVALLIYGMNNFEGRYRQGGQNEDDHARGDRQWSAPWSTADWLQLSGAVYVQQYCQKYGGTWEELLGPIVVNQHRNGLLKQPSDYEGWGYYAKNGPSGLTYEEYVNARPVIWPSRIWDCDRPCHSVGAFLFTTAERARDMRQKPVYVMNHNEGSARAQRSSQQVLEDAEEGRAWVAKMVYEGSGWRPQDVDIFNPYDGYSMFLPLSLEAFQWHGVKKGEAKDLVKGDISVKGPHPFSSGGGNLGNGRTRTAMYIDSIQQLRGTAGPRQVRVKAETAICAYAPGVAASYICLANSPS